MCFAGAFQPNGICLIRLAMAKGFNLSHTAIFNYPTGLLPMADLAYT
jgi:hypothetical protein